MNFELYVKYFKFSFLNSGKAKGDVVIFIWPVVAYVVQGFFPTTKYASFRSGGVECGENKLQSPEELRVSTRTRP